MPLPKTLEDKQAEQSRLAKAYYAAKRKAWALAVFDEPRLLDVQRDIRAMRSPAAILAYLRGSWVMEASPEVRLYVLRIVNAHADKMIRAAGGEALNDPMPPAVNLFIAARELLGVR